MPELFKQNLTNIKPYHPGKPIEEVLRDKKIKNIIKLSSNENPFGPSPKAYKLAKKILANVHFYPEKEAPDLKRAIARQYQLRPENIIVGNGSDEVMQMCAAATINSGDEVITADCTFALYEFVARLFEGTPVFVPLKQYTYDLDAIYSKITDRTRLIFIANPNNPTGTIVKDSELKAFLEKVPDHVFVVIDEAYGEYTEDMDYPDIIADISKRKNLIVLRTFSKIYGLAGLRLGYGMAHPEVIQMLEKTRLPFNTNRIAQLCGIAAMDDRSFIKKSIINNRSQKKFLCRHLDKMGISYIETQANFLAILFSRPGRDIAAQLLKKGIIVRPMDSFGMPNAIRVTIGMPENNKRFIAALKNIS